MTGQAVHGCPSCGLIFTHRDGCPVPVGGSRCPLCGLVGWHWSDCPAKARRSLTRDYGLTTAILVAIVVVAGMILLLLLLSDPVEGLRHRM